MASGSANCTGWRARRYEGGWADWYTDFTKSGSDGYCYSSGNTSKAYCFSFVTPNVSNFLKSTSLEIIIPIIRFSGYEKSGTLYFKLLDVDEDPTGGSLSTDFKPTSSNKDASCNWPAACVCKNGVESDYGHVHQNTIDNQDPHKVKFIINSANLKPNKRYYVTVGGSVIIGIGYRGYTPSNSWWSATFNYSTYSNGTSPSINIKDNGNNTVTISGALGKNGDSNTIESATLYYTLDNSDPSSSSTRKSFTLSASSGSSYSKSIDITKKCTVKAYIKCTFEYNSTSASKSVSAIYYAAPSAPGIPKVTYTKSRLTLKENWKVTWDVATAANSDSPIKGYRFRIYKKAAGTSKFTTIPVYDTSGKLLSADMGTDSSVIDHRYYYDVASVSMTIDPTKHNIAVGDTIKIGLYAYTKNGAGTQLFTASQTFSSDLVVQNAGIVQTKVNNTWVEGQVYIKVNGSWLEAETVNTKVNGTWKESE